MDLRTRDYALLKRAATSFWIISSLAFFSAGLLIYRVLFFLPTISQLFSDKGLPYGTHMLSYLITLNLAVGSVSVGILSIIILGVPSSLLFAYYTQRVGRRYKVSWLRLLGVLWVIQLIGFISLLPLVDGVYSYIDQLTAVSDYISPLPLDFYSRVTSYASSFMPAVIALGALGLAISLSLVGAFLDITKTIYRREFKIGTGLTIIGVIVSALIAVALVAGSGIGLSTGVGAEMWLAITGVLVLFSNASGVLALFVGLGQFLEHGESRRIVEVSAATVPETSYSNNSHRLRLFSSAGFWCSLRDDRIVSQFA